MIKTIKSDLKFGDTTRTEFMRKVYEAQVKWQKNRGRKYFEGLSASQLSPVEGQFKMKPAAATAAKKLLKAARDDLKAAQAKNDINAKKVTSIGISSTYRDTTREKSAYLNAFKTHYNGFLSRKFTNIKDRHGAKGLAAMTVQMINKKAPPGFSNHTSGVAIDFKTTESGRTLGPNSSQKALWEKSWFYKWMGDNDSKYGFKRLKTEQWHWDYTGVIKKQKSTLG